MFIKYLVILVYNVHVRNLGLNSIYYIVTKMNQINVLEIYVRLEKHLC